ncbi:DUF547 domain-containing protein [Aureivirga sp. CE67]|uniref:DUF547 domain-containing protein n=1 Tax=Aureivirga sp. CE67 TaxID=1788983 RepID=UPI0018CBB38E|nr:DUF547 domain-containing protein [Aureivirga sp. CE67]
MNKKILLIVVIVLSTITTYAQSTKLNTFLDKSDDFFKKYVSNGFVDYKELSKNTKSLDKLLELSNEITVSKSNENEFKAFWINVYNLGVIKQISENYPINSPLDVGGFFKTNKMELGGKKITLNDLENKILRGNFEDPRFHFVLVCGAISCPPITNFAYRPEILEQQMEKQARLALNDPQFLRVKPAENTVEMSQIMVWYTKDFTNTGKTLIQYVNQYLENKIPEDYKVKYYKYNWKLNDQKGSSIIDGETAEGSNIQVFTPSKLLKKGQWDFKIFNNLYTQTQFTDSDGKVHDSDRENYFTTTLEVYTGISKSSRINVGVIANVKSNSRGGESATSVFRFKNEKDVSAFGLTSIAPSIKIQPFKNVSNFSFQSSFFIPLVKNESKDGVFLDKKSYVWETRFYYDYSFGRDKFQFFGEVDFQYNFGKKEESFANNSLGLPVSAFLSYFPSDIITVYINAQHYELFDLGSNFSQNYTLAGFGAKFQVTPSLNLETSVSKFLRGRDAGLGQTFNLGLRYILSK